VYQPHELPLFIVSDEKTLGFLTIFGDVCGGCTSQSSILVVPIIFKPISKWRVSTVCWEICLGAWLAKISSHGINNYLKLSSLTISLQIGASAFVLSILFMGLTLVDY
jgi:hypothetical protein